MCKSMWMQALDTIVPFYAVSGLLQPSFCNVSSCPPTTPPRSCRSGWWTRWFVPWCGFSSRVQHIRSEAKFKPLLLLLITVNLVIFIFDQWRPHFADVWWTTSPHLSFGCACQMITLDKLHSGPIIDSENFYHPPNFVVLPLAQRKFYNSAQLTPLRIILEILSINLCAGKSPSVKFSFKALANSE